MMYCEAQDVFGGGGGNNLNQDVTLHSTLNRQILEQEVDQYRDQ